jgi:hypothetical protein
MVLRKNALIFAEQGFRQARQAMPEFKPDSYAVLTRYSPRCNPVGLLRTSQTDGKAWAGNWELYSLFHDHQKEEARFGWLRLTSAPAEFMAEHVRSTGGKLGVPLGIRIRKFG